MGPLIVASPVESHFSFTTSLTNLYPMISYFSLPQLCMDSDITWCFTVKLAVLQRIDSWYLMYLYKHAIRTRGPLYLCHNSAPMSWLQMSLNMQYIATTIQIHIGKSLAIIEHHPVMYSWSLEFEGSSHHRWSREVKSFKDEEDRDYCREENNDGVGKSFREVQDWWDSECYCCFVFYITIHFRFRHL